MSRLAVLRTLGLLLLVLPGAGAVAAAEQPPIIAEHLRGTVLETPHPYPAAGGDEPRLVWSDSFEFPGATYLVFEFARFDLAPGDRVEVRDPAGKQLHVYSGLGFKNKGGDFITKMILGPSAVIDLYSTNPENRHYGYRIERITRGFSPAELGTEPSAPGDFEAICGSDDKEDAVCYESEFPDVYDRARAVVRIVMDGSALCTAWVVSCQNHLLTNNHCTWDDDDFDTQGELDRMEFQFMYEDTSCGGGGATVEYSFMGGTWLENHHNLDYTLIQAPGGENPAATYGWLLIDDRLADIDELMYIVGHPSGRPKEISLYSTDPTDQDNPDGFCEVRSVSEPVCVGGSVPEIGYQCDTEGGNSGSPVLSRDTNKVIALHHCANCPNRGVRIQDIWATNQAGANALPACSLFDDIGAVTIDRQRYGCADTISIQVSDGSIRGAGSQPISIWSDSEPTAETVTLTESPADSGTFVGAVPTVTGAAVSGDGLLSVADSDLIRVRYIDADDGQGGVNLPRDATATADCVEPLISNIAVTDIAGTGATVRWSTDEPADSTVFHSAAPPPWAMTAESDLVTSHAVEISGLIECTVHDFWLRSSDEAGNSATDDNLGANHSFETGVNVLSTYSYGGPPLAITDNASTVSIITVGEDLAIQDLDVQIDVTHTYTGDLDIFLTAPNSVQIALTRDNGGTGENYSGTIFDDEAATAIAAGSAPFTGSFRPEVPLSTFDGLSVQGDWQLTVTDDAAGDTGTLNWWNITATFPPRACGHHASYDSHIAEADLCGEGGSGELDGVWDPGEEVTFRLTITNDGTDPLTGVTATVIPLDAGIVMTRDTASFGDIAVGESTESPSPHFAVLTPSTLPCGTTLSFEVEVTSDAGSWTDTFGQTIGNVLDGGGIVLDENFESGIPPTWQVTDGGSTADSWYADSAADPAGCANTDPLPPIAGSWAAADSDCAGTGEEMDEILATPPLDLQTASTVTLEFDHYFNQHGTELADVDVRSSLTGGSWINVGRWSGDTANPQSESIDISVHAAGAADLQLRWHYYVANFAWYWYVDNVVVSFTAPGSCEANPCGESLPPSAQGGALFVDRGTLTWDLDPLASGGYTVYRGSKSGLPSLLDSGMDSCVRFTSAGASENSADISSDNPIFVPGRLFWYLITGSNGGGEGGAGDSYAGPRRIDATGSCPGS